VRAMRSARGRPPLAINRGLVCAAAAMPPRTLGFSGGRLRSGIIAVELGSAVPSGDDGPRPC
jgi:hypothetical protein